MNSINISGFNKNSITDGPGIRLVVFCQGCIHACPGCHNPQTHSFGTGEDYTVEEIYQMIKRNPMIKGVTFSGGEPFCQPKGFLALARMLKKDGYELCAYTGYEIEQLMEDKEDYKFKLLEQLDILIDGRFELEKKSLDLKFKGSSNQRTLDVRESLKAGIPVLSKDERWV